MIVVTDASAFSAWATGRNGMGIPVASSRVQACAGVPRAQCLPVMLDVAPTTTNCWRTRSTSACLGSVCAARPTTPLLDEFIAARRRSSRHGGQFRTCQQNASRLLHKWRDRHCTFNDDIQARRGGAGRIVSALRVRTARSASRTRLFLGAGEAPRDADLR